MYDEKQSFLDVVIIGGGPAGISGALELSRSSNLKVALFEREPELGGIPRSCHNFFGMRDRKRIYSGSGYAKKLESLVRKTSIQIYTQAKVLKIVTGGVGEPHRIEAVSPQGMKSYETKFILLATGCFESSRGARLIPGARPSGILTTRTLQTICNIWHKQPGKKALIIGSEHVALSSIMSLKKVKVDIAGLVEKNQKLQTYPIIAKTLGLTFSFPIYTGTTVKEIVGKDRVEGVKLIGENNHNVFNVECDTVVICGKFLPDSVLIDNTAIMRDPSTLGPLVDENLMTSVPNVFAAGNVLRGANAHDLCALEGVKAAKSIIKKIETKKNDPWEGIAIRAESPIRYVVPQVINPNQTNSYFMPRLHPGCSIQLKHTINNPIIEAWSGDEIIWKRSFRKLIGNTRIHIPTEKFDWHRANKKMGITLRLQSMNSRVFLGLKAVKQILKGAVQEIHILLSEGGTDLNLPSSRGGAG